MAKEFPAEEGAGFFSAKFVSELQSTFKELFGREISDVEAQQIGLRIAQFVFIKEAKKKEAIKTNTTNTSKFKPTEARRFL